MREYIWTEEQQRAVPIIGAVIGVVVAYFAQPLLKYADPRSLAVVGVGFGFSLSTLYALGTLGAPRFLWGFAVLACLSMVFVGWLAVAPAYSLAVANDRRCLAIETEMLTRSEDRDKSAAVFQAFDCRVQISSGPTWADPRDR